ncbi:hypothetical protein GH733_013864 [Mirounga leonina]|nr:hypothetical protein GH733_013864 [Mirounga leonina]
MKHGGNITFNEVVNIARQMRHPSLARELSGTTEETPGTAQSVGCSVDVTTLLTSQMTSTVVPWDALLDKAAGWSWAASLRMLLHTRPKHGSQDSDN